MLPVPVGTWYTPTMLFSQRLLITARVALYALLPPRKRTTPSPILITSSTLPTEVSSQALRWALADLSQHVRTDGTLALFFPGCLAPAAPFLLFHLKRRGFSSCRATTAPGGLLLAATR